METETSEYKEYNIEDTMNSIRKVYMYLKEVEFVGNLHTDWQKLVETTSQWVTMEKKIKYTYNTAWSLCLQETQSWPVYNTEVYISSFPLSVILQHRK